MMSAIIIILIFTGWLISVTKLLYEHKKSHKVKRDKNAM
jgi:hypothetical protein|nr:MAG TPA: hypothetical protein [Caudoviricetes sp.]